MKQARNLTELYQNLELGEPLKQEDKDFYVDLYQDELKHIRTALLANKLTRKCFYIAGQRGNGKSTAMWHLLNEKLREKYAMIFISANNMINYTDTDIIDVILMIGFCIVKEKPELEAKYLDKLNQLKATKLKKRREITESQTKSYVSHGGNIDLKTKLNFFQHLIFDAGFASNYKVDKEKRKLVRELFSIEPHEITALINEVIEEYNAELEDERELLLIIDDLEKISEYKQIKKIFIDNAHMYQNLKAVKIIATPMLTNIYSAYNPGDLYKLCTRIKVNPLIKRGDSGSGEEQKNRDKLKEIVHKRMDNKEMIAEDALNQAIDYSGGNIRQLFSLFQQAVLNALTHDENAIKISTLDMDYALDFHRRNLASAIHWRIDVFKHVAKTNCAPQEEQLQDAFNSAIQELLIIAYVNGDPWYEINPIIQPSLENF